jgi:hypothetical protein
MGEDAQFKKLQADIRVLQSIQFQGMTEYDRRNLADAIGKIELEYETARELEKTDRKNAEKWKSVQDSIAKGLPNVVKSAFAADVAFKKGDYVASSVAMMELSSAAIPIFAAVLGVGGGAVVGAIFLAIGQIPGFYAPKQPSLEDKIKKILDHLQSEKEIQTMTAVGHSIASYTTDLRRKCEGVHLRALAGTAALTPGSATVTGTNTTFKTTLQAGQWLVFTTETSQSYRIEAIANETSLTLTSLYTGAATASTAVSFKSGLTEQRSVTEILRMPLGSEEEADAFVVQMRRLELGLLGNQQKLIVPAFKTWEVARYLERKENQGKEGWPEVLGTWCRAYSDLLAANMMLRCLADPKAIAERYTEIHENKASSWKKHTRNNCHDAVEHLTALMEHLREAWESDNDEVLRIANAVTPAARERGLYVHVGENHWLYAAPGRKGNLQWDAKRNAAYTNRFSINNKEAGSITPRYELILSVLGDDGRVQAYRHQLDPVNGDLSDGVRLYNLERDTPADVTAGFGNCRDVCWLPDGNDAKVVRLYTANGWGESWGSGRHWLHIYAVDASGNSTRVNWRPGTLSGLQHVRALYHPLATLPDDPDGEAMTDRNATPLGPLVSPKQEIISAGYVGNKNIWAGTIDSCAHVLSPWNEYNGIEVDPYYLWVFRGTEGDANIACATHASVIKCRQGKLPAPNWITYTFKLADFAAAATEQEKSVKRWKVVSLYPCSDGTLAASLQWDTRSFWTANYEINLRERRIDISSWVQRNGEALHVHKMPIPCWSLLMTLKRAL